MSVEELSALPRFFFFLCQNVSDFDILMMLYLRQRTREKSKDGGISMKNFEEIIAKIDRENGTTPENVLREMQLAIDHAYDHHDKEAQKLWDMMSFKSDRPTPEEFIFQVAMMLDKNGSLH